MSTDTPTESPSKRRLFFALWPDTTLRRAILERRALLDNPAGRPVPKHNLHVTLLFLGDQPSHRLPAIERAAAKLNEDSEPLLLDRFGWFGRAQALWLGGEPPPGLQRLVAQLQKAMQTLGLNVDERPWQPHITLYRKVRSCPTFPLPPPLLWPANNMSLIESIPQQPYRVLKSWPLTRSNSG